MRIFITTILPEQLIAKNNLSFAACNFSSNLISGNGFDRVYSTMPSFVHSYLSGTDGDGYEIVYSSLHRKGKIFSKLSVIHDQWILFKRLPKDASIWLYNLCQMNFLLVILLRVLKPRVQVNVIELDFTPSPKFSLLGLCLYLMNNAHSMICLADSPLFTNKNKMCLPGVVPKEEVEAPKIVIPTKTFLLSGAMAESISSLSKVLPAFANNPACTLHITGKVDDGSVIYDYTKKYKNIIYHGQLAIDEYLDLLHSVTFQVSTRDPNHPDNTCNFPSKIIEALVHNRAVISTISYSQLDGINYMKVDVDNLTAEVRTISEMNDEDIARYCNQGDKIQGLFSPQKWYDTMKVLELRKN